MVDLLCSLPLLSAGVSITIVLVFYIDDLKIFYATFFFDSFPMLNEIAA